MRPSGKSIIVSARRGNLAGPTPDQPGRDRVGLDGRCVAVHPLEQDLARSGADRGGVLRDDRDRGLEHVREQDVVEPDQRDPLVQA